MYTSLSACTAQRVCYAAAIYMEVYAVIYLHVCLNAILKLHMMMHGACITCKTCVRGLYS